MNNEHEIEAYQEACQMFRHYANLRFATLTVFMAITGALIGFAFQDGGLNPHFRFACVSGIVVAFALGAHEKRIDELMRFFAKKMFDIADQLDLTPVAKRRPELTFFGKLAGLPVMLTIYAGAIALWLVALSFPAVHGKP